MKTAALLALLASSAVAAPFPAVTMSPTVTYSIDAERLAVNGIRSQIRATGILVCATGAVWIHDRYAPWLRYERWGLVVSWAGNFTEDPLMVQAPPIIQWQQEPPTHDLGC